MTLLAALPTHAQNLDKICSQRYVKGAQIHFAKDLKVVNLREETDTFPELASEAELQDAFLKMRDSHIVKIDRLQLKRSFLWPKLEAVESGYAKIPWEVSEEHCYIRAELGAGILADSGRPVPVAISVVSELERTVRSQSIDDETNYYEYNLHRLAPQPVLDVSGDPLKTIAQKTQTLSRRNREDPIAWAWHVAVGYAVNGQLWILDPSIDFNRPMKFEDWHSKLTGGTQGTEVEIGWPFGIRKNLGKSMELTECYAGSLPQAYLHDEPHKEELSDVYANFQKQILLGQCRGTIDETTAAKQAALFWQIAGALKKTPDAEFIH